MLKQDIINLVKNNIDKFNPIDFCPNGGYAMFDKLDIIVSQIIQGEKGSIVHLTLLYDCDIPGACFAGSIRGEMLDRKILIGHDNSVTLIP